MGNAIKKYRQDAGITQAALAQLLGMSPQYLSDIELDRRQLTDERILALPPGDLRDALSAARKAEYDAAKERLRA